MAAWGHESPSLTLELNVRSRSKPAILGIARGMFAKAYKRELVNITTKGYRYLLKQRVAEALFLARRATHVAIHVDFAVRA